MAIGPVQLLVLGFNDAEFSGELVEELERLRQSAAVRVIDSLALYKTSSGEFEVQDLGEARELGRLIGALVGLAVDGEEDLELASTELYSDEDEGWAILQDIPNDTAAALVLIEHQWAGPLREAIVRTGGFRISDGFISPPDLGVATTTDPDTEMFGPRSVAPCRTRRVARRRRHPLRSVTPPA